MAQRVTSLDGDTIQSQDFYTALIPSHPAFRPRVSTGILRSVQLLFLKTLPYFYSHIYHSNGCRTLHHVETAPFPSVAEGPRPTCLVSPELTQLWAFCNE